MKRFVFVSGQRLGSVTFEKKEIMLGEHRKHRQTRQKILRKTSPDTLERKGQKEKINREKKEGIAMLTSFLLLSCINILHTNNPTAHTVWTQRYSGSSTQISSLAVTQPFAYKRGYKGQLKFLFVLWAPSQGM